MAHIFGSIWDRFNRNALNDLSKSVEQQGRSIQDLVAEGQLTPEQYENLIKTVNGLIAKGELSVDDIDINRGKLLPKHLSEEVLSMITGDAPINAVPADGSLTSRKYADKSITPSKTTFMTKTKNLFDGYYYDLILNYYSSVEAMQYLPTNLVNWNSKTAIVPIEPNETYALKVHDPELNDVFRIAVADVEIDFNVTDWTEIYRTLVTNSQTTKQLTFTNDGKGKYLLINLSDHAKEPRLQVEKGEEYTDYEEPFVISENLIDKDVINKIEEWKKIKEVVYNENLFIDYIEGTYSNTSGNFAENDTTVVSEDYIYVSGNEITIGVRNLNDGNRHAKVAFYDIDKNFISTTPFLGLLEHHVLDLPPETHSIKAVVSSTQKYDFFINLGETPYFELDDDVFSSGFSEIVPDSVVSENHLSRSLRDKINGGIQGGSGKQHPYPNKVRWETLIDDDSIKVMWMSSDGKVIYAGRATRVMQSIDEGETWQYVTGGHDSQILGIRPLDDGELIYSTTRMDDIGVKSKLFKTIGYNRDDLSNVTTKEVLNAKGVYANFNNSWGIDAFDNIVLASEYGLQGEDGARYAFLSTDFGNTWKEIFDQKNVSETVSGAPNYTSDAHVHTVHYDRYRERIWVVVGDQANCATYYSDDLGVTWKVVPGSTGIDAVQYTGITSYPEAVFFGSDRVPDGIHYWKDNGDKNDVRIKPFHLTVRKNNVRTLVYGLPYRRFNQKDEVTYFAATRDIIVNNEMSGIIVAFKGIHGAQVLYDFTDDYPNSAGVTGCVGETVEGNLLASIKVGDSYKVIRAKAPIWE